MVSSIFLSFFVRTRRILNLSAYYHPTQGQVAEPICPAFFGHPKFEEMASWIRSGTMQKTRFTEGRMVKMLQEADRTAVAEVAKKCGVSDHSVQPAQALRLWRGNRDTIIPFFQFLPEIRKVIYTTNAIELLNMSLRKLTRNRRIFPNDDSALKPL